jgi:chemotaxis protein histidine kinase CheA
MPALREACLKLGGKIEVETENKKGTTVRMTLPCLGAQTGEALWK